jgi:hypothetical protein
MGRKHDLFVDKDTGKVYGGWKDGSGLEDTGLSW